ncbi:hypothetical protein [Thermoproteus tenax]|uniref:hypothetical protein n=1 Tax=Thermoproteus tenax TaxID=2271 RepID=UPI001432ED1C|nr:hypothetical protein [Thermoproteus tenax]
MLCLFGPDGSGKSTLARSLVSEDVSIAWMRGSHTFVSLLARFLSRFRVFRGGCNPYFGICVPPPLKPLWVWLELLSAFPVVLLKYVFPKAAGRRVVGERSPVDLLVWLVLTLRDAEILSGPVARLALALHKMACPRSLYVRADLDVLRARRAGSPEAGLLDVELAVYDKLAQAIGAPVLDTTSCSVDKCAERARLLLGL